MIKRLYEKYKIILVYTLLAMIIGVIVGIIDVIFGRVLLTIGEFREGHNLYLIPFLPIAGIVIVLLYQRLSKESIKGMTLVFETGHGDRDKIPKMLVPLVILSTWITHLFGGSAGREGVAVQLGATVSHNIGEKLKIKDEGKTRQWIDRIKEAKPLEIAEIITGGMRHPTVGMRLSGGRKSRADAGGG